MHLCLKLSDVQKSRDELRLASVRWESLSCAQMTWNSQEELSWHLGRHEMRWEDLRWDELKWSTSEKCGAWNMKNAMWSVRKVFAWQLTSLHRGRAQVMFLDTTTTVLGRVLEVWSVDCEVWSVKCEVWSAKSAVWSVKCGVWSV